MRRLLKFKISCFAMGLALASIAVAGDDASSEPPDIRQLPRLREGLPPGTIAWATIDQLHPMQPQAGFREVKRKSGTLKEKLGKNENKFSEELYKFFYKESLAPVYVGPVPAWDSRFGRMRSLGYLTDRTHSSFAHSRVIKRVYGEHALSEPIYDKQGRPLNYVLVRVERDWSTMNEDDFARAACAERRCYLKRWNRAQSGETTIEDIPFAALPEKVYQTTENPYRDLLGDLQHDDKLARSSVPFSQFYLGEVLATDTDPVVSWDDIQSDAKDGDYDKAKGKAAKYFRRPEMVPTLNQLGFETKSKDILLCSKIFQ